MIKPRLAILALFASFFLIACEKNPQGVQGAYSTPSPTAIGACVGAAYGGTVLGIAGMNAPVGALGFATVGALLGAYMQSTPALIRSIEKSGGMQIIILGDQMRVIISSDAFFLPGSYEIQTTRIQDLNNLAQLLSKFGYVPIDIHGYTDTVFSDKASSDLSDQEADSIRAFLWSRGVHFRHVYPRGYGKKHPIANNKNIYGAAMNRRVEVLLLIQEKEPLNYTAQYR